MSFVLTTFLHFLCISISAVLLGLSIVSSRLLLTWVNSVIAGSALVYHITVLVANRFYGARTKKPWKGHSYLSNLSIKMPQAPPPSYDRHHYSSSVVRDDSGDSLESTPSGPFYSGSSLFLIVILIVTALIGFIMTVDVLLRGALGLPSGERENWVTFHLNIKVQKAQCTFLGVLILLWLVVLALCVRGRNRISKAEEEERDEFQVGYVSRRESIEIPVPLWNKAIV